MVRQHCGFFSPNAASYILLPSGGKAISTVRIRRHGKKDLDERKNAPIRRNEAYLVERWLGCLARARAGSQAMREYAVQRSRWTSYEVVNHKPTNVWRIK